jgi:probable phosphoglycerate mutase
MTKIVLIRHGHVEGIRPERFRGRADLALTELGEAQAKAVAARVAAEWTPDALYTSPMRRCLATAAAITEACGVAGTVLDDLIDIDYGDWQWRTWDEVKATSPELLGLWSSAPHLMRFPGGDALQDVAARAADALRFAIHRHPAATDTVILIGHDSVNRALLSQLLDQPISAYWRLGQHPCALNEIEIVGDRVVVLRVNDAAHLDGLWGPPDC